MKAALSNRSSPYRVVRGPLATDVFRRHDTRVITYHGEYVQGALYVSVTNAQRVNAATGLPEGTDPNPPDGVEFVEVTMGTRGNTITFECDARQGVAIPVAGEIIEVNVKSPDIVATIPQVPVLGDVTVEFIPYAHPVNPTAPTRTVRYGDIAPLAISPFQPIPKYAAEWIAIPGLTRNIDFAPSNSTAAANVYTWSQVFSSGRQVADVSSWAPVPARCSRARVASGEAAATITNFTIVYRLAL